MDDSCFLQVEEVGWENLVKLDESLAFVSFRIKDTKGRAHIIEIHLPQSYPRHAPSISADVPHVFELNWSTSLRLKDVVQKFHEHLENLHDFWSTLDDIDSNLWVVSPRLPSRATSFRHINVGNDCCIVVSINVWNPRSLPECRFLGPDSAVCVMRKTWRRNNKRWVPNKSFHENFASILEISLPKPPVARKDDQQLECGICYAQCLPIDDELGDKSGSAVDYICDNNSCGRAFHNVCLEDWLHSITTTRQSFNVLFGNCPYCSGPVAVKVNAKD
ncbi:hypothetical protein Syun_004463 [Stephania yunnanensis]|uniref:E3 ubiquitin-protein ligase FANCL n=1 Tax=Stephania yunnanensis TaxID=152371 RepID=A0AAP0L3J0_9MAGN